MVAGAYRVGYVTTLLGGRRHFSKAVTSEDSWIRSAAERQMVNYRVQSSAAEQTKLAIGRLWVDGTYRRSDVTFYAPLHDEVIQSVPTETAAEVGTVIREVMEQQYADMIVPMKSTAEWGPNFGEQIYP